ncbi:MAG: hypothetical protein Q4B68_09580 [Bacteroidales bacterium]|nr:hypothetical protein [Bacteroidales bacterium]
MKQQYSESALALSISMSLYTLVLFIGVITRLINLGGVDSLAMQQISSVVKDINTFNILVSFLNLCLVGINIAMGLIIQKCKHPIIWCLSFIIALMSVVSVFATFVTGNNPLVNFFLECCGIMAYFAWVLDLTYKEFCVIGNIYLQAGLCLMASFMPLLLCVRKQRISVMSVFCLINTLIHSLLFFIISIHYWMPLEKGFDLCYRELNQLAAYTGTTYVFVNIVIFVIMFIGDLILNSVIYRLSRLYITK